MTTVNVPERLLLCKAVPHGAVRLWALVQRGYSPSTLGIARSTLHRWQSALATAGYPIHETGDPINGTVEIEKTPASLAETALVPSVGQPGIVEEKSTVPVRTERTAMGAYKTLAIEQRNQALVSSEILFDTFWQLYPNRQGKKQAFGVWNKLKVQDNPRLYDDIITGVHAYRRHCSTQRLDRSYILHPTTYLRGERWRDEFESLDNDTPVISKRTQTVLDAAERFVRRREQ
tara:strand:- start:1148 stop:1843 length:696 start_codon:yes stop_codon:yes gene_type:complete